MESVMKKSLAFRLFLRFSALVLALALLPVCALGEESAEAPEATVVETYPWALGDYLLPIDFTPGAVPNESGYKTAKDAAGNDVLSYEDSTIKVTVSQFRFLKTIVFVADIEIADPSQLRTVSMDKGDFSQGAKARAEQYFSRSPVSTRTAPLSCATRCPLASRWTSASPTAITTPRPCGWSSS